MRVRVAHWERVYAERDPTEVSWYQADPALSLTLIQSTGIGHHDSIIDVGGGASLLVDRLLDLGFTRVTILDIAETALCRAKERLGPRATRVTWVAGDVTATPWPAGAFELWHDRAVFHFLTEAEDRRKYREHVTRALAPSGHLIIATFALDGPPCCSGLPIMRYNAAILQQELGSEFTLVETRQETHRTPAGAQQHFVYGRFKKISR